MKICSKCGKFYNDGNFCEYCKDSQNRAIKLTKAIKCPSCNNFCDITAKYCKNCGTELGLFESRIFENIINPNLKILAEKYGLIFANCDAVNGGQWTGFTFNIPNKKGYSIRFEFDESNWGGFCYGIKWWESNGEDVDFSEKRILIDLQNGEEPGEWWPSWKWFKGNFTCLTDEVFQDIAKSPDSFISNIDNKINEIVILLKKHNLF